MTRNRWFLPTLFVLLLLPSPLLAQDAIDSGDTAWMLVSSALVMLMIPGLALFYGGMVRSNNVLSTIMYSMIALGLITIQWVVVGYSLAFGPDVGGLGFIGNFDHLFLRGVGIEPSGTIPVMVFMIFQGMFAIITPALISGAIAERMKFSAYCWFIVLWATFVYDPIAHWVWGPDGWLLTLGALDFAGGTVVHLNAGVSALVLVLFIGKRLSYKREPIYPNNLPLTMLGAALLWFGWFGFNAGSALAANASAAQAFVATHIATAAAATSWTMIEWWHAKKPSMLGTASGIVAGLVAITPAAGFVTPMGALIIGLIAGVVCYLGVLMKRPLGYDDSLDVFGIHVAFVKYRNGVTERSSEISVVRTLDINFNPRGEDVNLRDQIRLNCVGSVSSEFQSHGARCFRDDCDGDVPRLAGHEVFDRVQGNVNR